MQQLTREMGVQQLNLLEQAEREFDDLLADSAALGKTAPLNF